MVPPFVSGMSQMNRAVPGFDLRIFCSTAPQYRPVTRPPGSVKFQNPGSSVEQSSGFVSKTSCTSKSKSLSWITPTPSTATEKDPAGLSRKVLKNRSPSPAVSVMVNRKDRLNSTQSSSTYRKFGSSRLFSAIATHSSSSSSISSVHSLSSGWEFVTTVTFTTAKPLSSQVGLGVGAPVGALVGDSVSRSMSPPGMSGVTKTT
mmetsp:Transcript_6877/g.16856  ORF Transcript_6877/g.16856 Transcript_6877/m.16856 type:complete len:203 (+) Transcript_6877:359-967(+)